MLKKYLKYFVCILFSIGSLPSFANNETCSEGECEKQFSKLLKYARNGSPEAQFLISYMFKDGAGTQANPKKAFKWMKKAAANQMKEAYYELALMYRYGKGTEVNLEKYERYINSAIDKKVEKAILYRVKEYVLEFQELNLGINNDERVKSLKANVVELLDEIKEDSTEAQVLLGRLYESGTLLKQDIGKAYRMYGLAAKNNDAFAIERVNTARAILNAEERENFDTQLELDGDVIMLVEAEKPSVQEMLNYSIESIKKQGTYHGMSSGSRLKPCHRIQHCSVIKVTPITEEMIKKFFRLNRRF